MMMNLGKFLGSCIMGVTLVAPAVEAVAFVPAPLEIPTHHGIEISLDLPASPSGGGVSDDTGSVGGGRRSPNILCTNPEAVPLTALMANTINKIDISEDKPLSLYWYLPKTQAQKAEFVLTNQDNEDKFVYFQEFDIPQDTEGLVRFDLPSNLDLDEETLYKFEIALVCQEYDRSSDEYVWGTVEILDDDEAEILNQELSLAQSHPSQEKATSIEEAMANVYIRHNLWHQAFALLAEPSSSFTQSTCNTARCKFLAYFGLETDSQLIGVVDSENGFMANQQGESEQTLNAITPSQGEATPLNEVQ